MYKLIRSVKLSWLAGELDLCFSCTTDEKIEGITSLNDACSSYLTFTSSNVFKSKGFILGTKDCNYDNIIYTENPRLDFIKALNILSNKIGFCKNEEEAKIHHSVVIGKNVAIDNNVIIGEGTVIDHNVSIHSGTNIGRDCIIGSNTTIGADGFGFERDKDGTPIKFIHFGDVTIGDRVQIGANNTISRGTLGDTVIKDDVKTDNLVHIAHNCTIRQGAFITAGSIFSGGVDFGKNAWMAPNSTIKQKLTIGDGALVGLGAVVLKDVEANSIVVGNPAKVLRRPN